MNRDAETKIALGQTALGIELGSTRIKSVLIDDRHNILATGSFQWENRLENGLWTYHLEDAAAGLQESYASLAADVWKRYGRKLETVGAIGISGMMHGYLALDRDQKPLAPFLTWRNTNTARAAGLLTEQLQFNIPLRWSIAHLYENILNGEAHVKRLDYLCTLSSYLHLLLSGQRVIGICEASGMFPIDPCRHDFDSVMLDRFDALIADKGYSWRIRSVLPRVLTAGEAAGLLTPNGARLLDPSGTLRPGIPMAPPEGDAGTGMVATNSVAIGTGNVSAGTSIFAMVVLDKPLRKLYRDIDMVTTPGGHPVAMVHCNNGTSEIDAWFRLFRDFAAAIGAQTDDGALYRALFQQSLRGDGDCGGVIAYNYLSGEPITGSETGCPMLLRGQTAHLTLANFMRAQIYSVFASLAIGMDILKEENVRISRLTAHGGLFKTPGVAQRYLSAAMEAPITVLQSAGEGGPYGMAILAAYMRQRKPGQLLEDYLQAEIFTGQSGSTIAASPEEIDGFWQFLRQYRRLLPSQNAAASIINR